MSALAKHAEDAVLINCDSVAVAIMSHGGEGIIYGVDGNELTEDELTRPFGGVLRKELVGKPKLFILQVCRGGR